MKKETEKKKLHVTNCLLHVCVRSQSKIEDLQEKLLKITLEAFVEWKNHHDCFNVKLFSSVTFVLQKKKVKQKLKILLNLRVVNCRLRL